MKLKNEIYACISEEPFFSWSACDGASNSGNPECYKGGNRYTVKVIDHDKHFEPYQIDLCPECMVQVCA